MLSKKEKHPPNLGLHRAPIYYCIYHILYTLYYRLKDYTQTKPCHLLLKNQTCFYIKRRGPAASPVPPARDLHLAAAVASPSHLGSLSLAFASLKTTSYRSDPDLGDYQEIVLSK